MNNVGEIPSVHHQFSLMSQNVKSSQKERKKEIKRFFAVFYKKFFVRLNPDLPNGDLVVHQMSEQISTKPKMEKSKDSRRKNQIAGMYDLGETIGEGHYAVVKLAKHVFTGETVAVKVIDKMKLDAATRLQMLQEVRLMKLVQHPFVVRLYEVIDTQTKLYLVLEFADGGDMYDYIMRHEGGLQEEMARKYFRQIVTAIQYCHKLHVVHRDLKPENVVFFEKLGLVKLTDFGFSNKFSPGQRLRTSCGSLAYSAPEILLGDAYDAPAVDIWSLGVILYMLVCGAAPFQEANDSETLTMIMDCKYTFPTHISPGCKSLISRMLQRQPELRSSLEDIIRDPWLNELGEAVSDSDVLPSWLEEMMPEEAIFPLAAREHLTEEDHANILQRMVHGSIAHREDIIDALDRNEYNHITATYFLLAERKLRAQRMSAKKDACHGDKPSSESNCEESAIRGRTGSNPSSPKHKENISEVSSSIVHSVVDSFSPRRVQRRSQTSMVDTLLSPQESPTRTTPPTVPSTSSGSPGFAAPTLPFRLRKCSIVEEEEEDSDEKGRQVRSSRHSSTSSLVDKSAALAEAAISLDLRLTGSCGEKLETPAPFPLTSRIGTGGLSRQGSLRKSGGETPSGSSPTSERKSVPGSPTTPTGSSATSSTHGSPARFKITMPNRKLASTRSSPRLVPSAPVLNQIHEEAEEGGGSPASSLSAKDQLVDLVDQFPSTPAGAVVIKRLEQRRRLRLLKARTASCSSSDASDDDSETRRKREQELSGHTPSPPPRATHLGRDRQNDDSSDSQDPGLAGTGGATTTNATNTTSTADHLQDQGSTPDPSTTTSGTSGNVKEQTPHRHRHHIRVRQSHSLNRISELHAEDFLLGCDGEDRSTKQIVVSNGGGSLQRQLSSESDSDTCDMLTRYLESLSANHRTTRSRDDSLNSSDGEFEGLSGHEQQQPRPPRRHKVNLLSLEQRLNKIQEECNKSGSEEDEDGDEGDVSDNVSTTVAEPQDDLADFKPNQFVLELTSTKPTTQRLRINKRAFNGSDRDETTSVKSCDVAPLRNNKERKHVLHRAHSCGSLFSLKERALLRRKLSNAHFGVAATFWDLIKTSEETSKVNKSGLQNELTLALTAASSPLTVFNLQSTSRCCSLC